ncbi:MAG: DLW-39 family protein [Actinomycetaceae bacterium]|nr:DLW-39 family protein [Actinomycetaceae bacterium]
MKKWITTLAVIGSVAVVGVIIHQIRQDLSEDAELWKSVTDTPALG